MIFQLPDKDFWFPDPQSVPEEYREDDGCFAVGGDLCPERLVEAYSQGIFPWSDHRSTVQLWYCPMRRFVIFPERVHVSHSMRTLMNKHTYTVTYDKDFEGVINQCSALRIDEAGAWLGKRMVDAFCRMHELGYGHSVEVWEGDRLVGGLYGLIIGKAFMGESMFSLVPSASKIALIALCRHLQELDCRMVDCQFETPHLRSMGGCYISYSEYMDIVWGK